MLLTVYAFRDCFPHYVFLLINISGICKFTMESFSTHILTNIVDVFFPVFNKRERMSHGNMAKDDIIQSHFFSQKKVILAPLASCTESYCGKDQRSV